MQFFLNKMYVELDNSISLISQVDKWNEYIHNTDTAMNPYTKLLSSINKMEILSENYIGYGSGDKNVMLVYQFSTPFRVILTGIGSGYIFDGKVICKDFMDDGVISEKEIAFLKTLGEELQDIKDGLHSSETNQENPNLSAEEFNKIVKPFVNKYSFNNLDNIGLGN
jgi:hypothetical protein